MPNENSRWGVRGYYCGAPSGARTALCARQDLSEPEHERDVRIAEYIDEDEEKNEAHDEIGLEYGAKSQVRFAHAPGEEGAQDLRAVERRKRDHVQYKERAVDSHNIEEGLCEIGHDSEAHGQSADCRDCEVRKRPGERGNGLAPLPQMFEIVRVHRHGLRPAEIVARERREYGDDDGAEDVDVRNRIERETPCKARRRIAEFVGGDAVRHFIHDDREDEYHDYENRIKYLHGAIVTQPLFRSLTDVCRVRKTFWAFVVELELHFGMGTLYLMCRCHKVFGRAGKHEAFA